MTKGRIMYVPKELLEELEDIQINFNIHKTSDGLKKIAENAKIGKKLSITLGFNKRPYKRKR